MIPPDVFTVVGCSLCSPYQQRSRERQKPASMRLFPVFYLFHRWRHDQGQPLTTSHTIYRTTYGA